MNRKYSLRHYIGVIEILIGVTTLTGLILSGLLFNTVKPFKVFLFVLGSSLISALLGVGIVSEREWGRKALIYFSGFVVLNKLLIFLGVIQLTGQMQTVMPEGIKDVISFLYHLLLIGYLTRPSVKRFFTHD